MLSPVTSATCAFTSDTVVLALLLSVKFDPCVSCRNGGSCTCTTKVGTYTQSFFSGESPEKYMLRPWPAFPLTRYSITKELMLTNLHRNASAFGRQQISTISLQAQLRDMGTRMPMLQACKGASPESDHMSNVTLECRTIRAIENSYARPIPIMCLTSDQKRGIRSHEIGGMPIDAAVRSKVA